MKRGRVPRRKPESDERRAFVADVLRARPWCEVIGVLHEFNYPSPPLCMMRASEVHEPLTRARGGSILDPENAMATCRPCHRWIHDHPRAATELGLLRSAGGV